MEGKNEGRKGGKGRQGRKGKEGGEGAEKEEKENFFESFVYEIVRVFPSQIVYK